MMNGKASLNNVLKAAGIFAVSIMGCGFATGQEILQFFTGYGLFGIIGSVIASALLSWFGFAFMSQGYEYNLALPDDSMKFYFGKNSGKYVGYVIRLFLFAVYVIMISGSGALLSECFGIAEFYGRVLNGIVVLAAVLFGLRKIGKYLGFLGPAILSVIFLVSIYAIVSGNESIACEQSDSVVKACNNWLVAAVLYPCFNSICLINITCTTGAGLNSKKEALYAGILGGLIFGISVMMINIGFLKNLNIVGTLAIPSLGIVNKLGRPAGYAFSVVMFIGICAGSVSMLWAPSTCFGEDGSKSFRIAAIIMAVLAQVLAVTDFKSLVNKVYPFSGYVGISILLITIWKSILGKGNIERELYEK